MNEKSVIFEDKKINALCMAKIGPYIQGFYYYY